jgi:erythromycin esterase-like protein
MSSHAFDYSSSLRQARTRSAHELHASLRRKSEALPALGSAGFAEPFDRFGSSELVLLGEATHGTSEFYRARAAITRHLIENHGFSFVSIEADWPDVAQLDGYVRHLAPKPNREQAFARFPQWMWRNEEFAAFIDWLRTYNRDLDPMARVALRGLDIYSLQSSIAAVLDFLERRDPAQAAAARQRYSCLTPWQSEPALYGHNALSSGDTCEDEAVEQLRALLLSRLAYLQEDGETFFDAAQNARVVRSAEQYYRLMYRSSAESWNLRDRHMFDTLQALLTAAGNTARVRSNGIARAVVWAHNSHVGNAAATSMGWAGEFNIGELCRKAYGNRCTLIGFGTDRGTVAAASDWGEPMEIKTVLPARADSYEHAFREAGVPCSLTDWRADADRALAEQLSHSLLQRAIGVIYRPETELQSHYFESMLGDQFDAWVWFEQTNAVRPLAPGHGAGIPDTYPFGM